MRHDPKSVSSRRVSFASFVGTAIEWYDFYLYGTYSALIFNQLFFPKFDPIAGIMAAYGTYAIGFFARPFGALLFGHFGDRLGRKKMLVSTLSIMGISTFLIGLLPTYHQAGVLAPILLVILRFFQGIGVGGEWGGAIVISAEHSRNGERGFYSSWPNSGAPCGLVLSIIVFLLFSAMPHDQFLVWGWRIPFLIGILLVGVGLYIRVHIMESRVFIEEKKKHSVSKSPVLELTQTSIKNSLLAIGARFSESASYYIFTVFILSYTSQQLHLSKNLILYGIMFASVFEVISIPFFGHLSDKIGRRPVYMTGALLVGLFAFPFFWLIETKNIVLIWLALFLSLSLSHAIMHGPQAAFFSELFKTRVRYSGAAITYHLSAALSGGLAPLIATGLVQWAHGHSWPVSLYLIFMSLITVVSVFLAGETFKNDLSK